MEALVWLLVPLMAAVGVGLWAWYVSRPNSLDLWTDVERYDRLRAGLSSPRRPGLTRRT
ncbi:hypothetical protein AB0A69_23785 [Streptomyces sp. NPDC045431]|uniref:hypothetical protein n=1 Tax=Streptomyces sp. NPDC045431 TaxID=3155613 RepID=UPI0033D5EE68